SGHETVADAMSDAALASFVQRMVMDDIIPALQPSPIDLKRYAEATFARFRNPAIHHRLSQIAWDGSQKLPYRLLDTILEARASGRPIERLVVPIAAWILFLERQARAAAPIADPLADTLRARARSNDPIDQILGLREVFPESLGRDAAFQKAVKDSASQLRPRGVAEGR
ncbi:MAG TPA: mannitol dehydrogenase family protein, partial [Sphingomicrobium sp.]